MTHTFLTRKRNGLEWLIAPGLAQFPWLLHAFSTRVGGMSGPPAGGLSLGKSVGRQPASVLANRAAFLAVLGAKKFSLASAHQVHSAEILEAVRLSGGKLQYRPAGCREKAMRGVPRADAMLTQDRGVLLSVRSADCLPILVVDPQSRAVAAIHAGWRGALKRIAEKAVGEMRRVLGSDPHRLFAALGPCIGPCCYEVGVEVLDSFSGEFTGAERYFKSLEESRPIQASRPSHPLLTKRAPGGLPRSLDIPAVVRDQLRRAGLPDSHIEAAGLCSSCHPELFFSYRSEGDAAGRMMAVIGVR